MATPVPCLHLRSTFVGNQLTCVECGAHTKPEDYLEAEYHELQLSRDLAFNY